MHVCWFWCWCWCIVGLLQPTRALLILRGMMGRSYRLAARRLSGSFAPTHMASPTLATRTHVFYGRELYFTENNWVHLTGRFVFFLVLPSKNKLTPLRRVLPLCMASKNSVLGPIPSSSPIWDQRGNSFHFSMYVSHLHVGSTSAALIFQPSGLYILENTIFPHLDQCNDFFPAHGSLHVSFPTHGSMQYDSFPAHGWKMRFLNW